MMIYILLTLFAVVVNVSALIIDTPSTRVAPAHLADSVPMSMNPTRAVGQQLFRIRHTRATDLDVISTMLAMEAVPFNHTHNWNNEMKRLRAKSEFTRQLTHRLAALDEGRLAASRLKQQYTLFSHDSNDDDIYSLSDDYDTCYQLWKIGNFRSKVRTAAKHSQENNAWKVHNFELTPSVELFNHVMLSVVHTLSGDVVGFCEVAWLPCPQQPNLNRETTQQYYAPAIVNLVTSSTYRRKGIASRLLKFASKYTATQWKRPSCDNDSTILGLYVQSENESALRLYRNEGFSQISCSEKDGLMYMRQKSKV